MLWARFPRHVGQSGYVILDYDESISDTRTAVFLPISYLAHWFYTNPNLACYSSNKIGSKLKLFAYAAP